jgi:hypothetical protein
VVARARNQIPPNQREHREHYHSALSAPNAHRWFLEASFRRLPVKWDHEPAPAQCNPRALFGLRTSAFCRPSTFGFRPLPSRFMERRLVRCQAVGTAAHAFVNGHAPCRPCHQALGNEFALTNRSRELFGACAWHSRS